MAKFLDASGVKILYDATKTYSDKKNESLQADVIKAILAENKRAVAKENELQDSVKTVLSEAKTYTNSVADDLEKRYHSGSIKTGGSASLPVIFISAGPELETLIQRTDVEAKKVKIKTVFKYVTDTENRTYYVILKLQGTSSLAYSKKNFTITFYTDDTYTEKLGVELNEKWGAQNKYCMKANYIDHSHARNIVGARLWSEVVSSRSVVNEELSASPNNGAIDGYGVRVYVNAKYAGLYTMNIPKDGWMFNMDEENTSHGIICGEDYNSSCFLSLPNIDGNDWSEELRDEATDEEKQSLRNAISFVMNSSDETFKSDLGNYFDVESLIDYYIFCYVICGLDSLGKNQIYITYDMVHWIASMYDMDSTFGLYWDGRRFVEATYRMQEDYETGVHNKLNKLYERMKVLFVREIQERYQQLRGSVLSYHNIMECFETFMTKLVPFYQDDIEAYPAIPSSGTNNIKQIRAFVQQRLAYTDTMMTPVYAQSLVINAPVSGLSINIPYNMKAIVTPTNANIYNLQWSVKEGVGSFNGNIYTSLEEGETTILVRDTVSGIEAEYTTVVHSETPSVLYELNNHVFDGTSGINTEIKFLAMEEATFEINFTPASDNNYNRTTTLFQCMDETNNTYPGISMQLAKPNGDELGHYYLAAWQTNPKPNTGIDYNTLQNHCIKIVKEHDKLTLFVNGAKITEFVPTGYVPVENQDLYIGCYWSGTATGRYWKGTVHSATIKSFADYSTSTLENIALKEEHFYVGVPKQLQSVTVPSFIQNTNVEYSVLSGDATITDGKLTVNSEGDVVVQLREVNSGFVVEKNIDVRVLEKVELNVSDIVPGERFEMTLPEEINIDTDTIIVKINNNNNNNNNPNNAAGTISIGNDIGEWKADRYGGSNFHTYYRALNNTIEYNWVRKNGNNRCYQVSRQRLGTTSIGFNKYGTYIDGQYFWGERGVGSIPIVNTTATLTGWTDFITDMKNSTTPIKIGQTQGDNRSFEEYTSITVYKSELSDLDIKSIHDMR